MNRIGEEICEREYAWERMDRMEVEFNVDREDEREEMRVAVRLRREYKMFPRIGMEKWDDYDFIYRFRLTKATTAMVLTMIEDRLKCDGLR